MRLQTEDDQPFTRPTDGDDPRALRLVSVLTTGLPAELGTPDEPALYTVPAVFSRQVSDTERQRIEDPATARALAEQAGSSPGLELAVSDRRLLIKNTSLAQLTGGLAAAIATMLDQLGRELLAETDRRTEAAEVLRTDEQERFDAVAKAAAAVHFDPVRPPDTRG